MAVLATLEQAQVLPPEGSREADRVIQSVIQLQSAFVKGTDRSVQDFAQRAVAGRHGEGAAPALERFRVTGWTAEILEALADADQRTPAEELERLETGFRQFNLSVDDFKRFMQLVREGRSSLAARGQNFGEVYAHHRNAMPGASAR
jgi:exonuclease VII small subunit